MKIAEIISFLETLAPPALQESYDNAGLLTGNRAQDCTGMLCTLDAVEGVIDEAIAKGCNLVVAHHPIIFSGLKRLNGNNYIERTLIKAIKNDIAIYAIHTNLDNIIAGVNGKIAGKLGLINTRILKPRAGVLKKLFVYVPADHAEKVKTALFDAGAGQIGNYSECSFSATGTGSFKPNDAANPFSGTKGQRHVSEEQKIEVIFPAWIELSLLAAMKQSHPYEEVAYEIIALDNSHQLIGSGLVGELPAPVSEQTFLQQLKASFGLHSLKHTRLLNKEVHRVAVCGGAGSFLLKDAINSKSDIYISSDFKYHEYFDADGHIVIADIGHYESEQFTIELLASQLEQKFPNFAVLKTTVRTNPVYYL